MDFLRFCYRTQMAMSDDDDTPVWVRWYKADPAAPLYTGPTPFRSRLWDGGRLPYPADLGELIDAPRLWVNGSNPDRPDGSGVCNLGGLDGSGSLVPSDDMPTSYFGTPICCNPPSVRGVRFCDQFGRDMPLKYTLRIPPGGGFGTFFYDAGDVTLVNSSPCHYRGDWLMRFQGPHLLTSSVTFDLFVRPHRTVLRGIVSPPGWPNTLYLPTAFNRVWDGLSPLLMQGGAPTPRPQPVVQVYAGGV